MDNFILKTDSYKVSHWKQYPPRTTEIYSYLEARDSAEYYDVVFFGLQYILRRHGFVPGDRESTARSALLKVLDEGFTENRLLAGHFGGADMVNHAGWERVSRLGYLPVEICAVPEGTVVPKGNVLMTIRNTDPECFWLTNYLETILMQVWYPCTVATISRQMKKVIQMAMERSGTDGPENLAYRLHDFGYRGSTSYESSAIGGAAHLVNFRGTDTLSALELVDEYYNDRSGVAAGHSIPAAEHSTITAWGEENEEGAYWNMLTQFPEGLVAVVSDSWDIDRAVRDLWAVRLVNQVNGRKGTVVIRPDSGDPCAVLPRVLAALWEAYEGHVNRKGYKVLSDRVRVIQGDGITRHSLAEILDAVMDAGWSADNVSFGSGGGLLQTCTRDTLSMAMKCSSAVIDGERRDVYKRPASDPKKNSKRGMLKLIRGASGYETVRAEETGNDVLRPVYRDGKLLVTDTFETIRQRARRP